MFREKCLFLSFQHGANPRESISAVHGNSLPGLQRGLLRTLRTILPVITVILILYFSVTPISPDVLLYFLLNTTVVVINVVFFALNTRVDVDPVNRQINTILAQDHDIPLVVKINFTLNFLVAVSRPSLRILTGRIPSVPGVALVLSITTNINFFLIITFLHVLLNVTLPGLLIIFCKLVFILTTFIPGRFLTITFSSNNIAANPVAIPFVVTLNINITTVQDSHRTTSSDFNLITLYSINPVLTILLLNVLFQTDSDACVPPVLPSINSSIRL